MKDMNNEIETRLAEIYENGKKIKSQIASYYRMVAEFSKLVEFDDASERMREDVVKMNKALLEVLRETIMY